MRALVIVIVAVALTGAVSCRGGGDASWGAFCDVARDHEAQLEEPGGFGSDLDETALDAITDLARQAPSEIRDDLDTITEGESLEEVQDAVDEVERALERECDLVL